MYDEPQVSSGGDWADATVVVDSEGRSNYSCRYCEFKNKYRCRIFQKLKDHVKSCKERISKLEEGKDFVHCKICNLHTQKLGPHIIKGHGMTIQEYKEKYSTLVISQLSFEKYSKASSGEKGTARHKSFLKRFGNDQEAIKEHYSKVGKKVSAAIMSSDVERTRRSSLMSTIIKDLVQDPNYIKSISDRAIETSKRPDVIENRTRQLKNWRDNNREDFYAKCTKKMLKKCQSKPEKKLADFLKNLKDYSFKGSQFVKSEIFSTKSKRKQVDVADKGRKIYVEYDGALHFEPIFGEEVLQLNKEKDMQLEKFISEKGWTLIRISCDQYVDKNKIEKSFFKQECLDKILKILQDNKPGIYKIGNKYG